MTQDAGLAPVRGLSVSGWPLRRKMALALAIPLLLATVLGGLRVAGNYTESQQATRSASQVTILQPAIDYLTAAETAVVAAQADTTASQGELTDAIATIETDAKALVTARDRAELTPLQSAHVDALLDLSQAMRGSGAEDLGPATWIALVRQLESSVSQLITSVNAAQETPEPRLEQLSQVMSGRLSLALQQGLVATDLSQSTSQDLFSELGVEAAAIDRLAGSVTGSEDATAQLRTQNTTHAGQVRDDAATDLDGAAAYAPYDALTATLVDGVTTSLDEAAASAQRDALIGALATALALLAALGLAYVVARSLLGPIGTVREGALAVARHRLPDAVARIRAGQEPEEITPIAVGTTEEIGQVARAVDDLHRQAIHLASGEAQLRQTVNAMFVTLSRRSTSLVNQQLAQIERLEHDEEDPKRLESLFRLDHLASRMRRTADSLLILADAPQRASGQTGLTVADAMQAATAGVQDYQRVQVLSDLRVPVSDDAAADIVHLLTELVDNALAFSPPTAPVRLAAEQRADGVRITVTDAGLGMPISELEQFNHDLEYGAEATPETARRMGLFVVSRLAQRHGIRAGLSRNPEGGLTAWVVLGAQVLPAMTATTYAPVAAAVAEPVAAAAPSWSTLAADDATPILTADAPQLSRRQARAAARAERASEKAADKAAQKAAQKQAQKEAQAEKAEKKSAKRSLRKAAQAPVVIPQVLVDDGPAVPLQASEPVRESALTPLLERTAPRTVGTTLETSAQTGVETTAESTAAPAAPSAGALLPRRAPGANLPRTGVEVLAASPEPVPPVAPVVPITALASRQRADLEANGPSRGPIDPIDPLGLGSNYRPLQSVASSYGIESSEAPIFRSMRSGWLTGDPLAFGETEVERGWEVAEQVADQTPVALSPAGLPRRAPGERLVPGSVAPPSTTKTRDPEAIRRRLQAHAAGVSRGRDVARSSTQHTEAGPS